MCRQTHLVCHDTPLCGSIIPCKIVRSKSLKKILKKKSIMSKSFHDTPLGGSYMTHLEGHTPLVCRQTHLPHDQLSDNILSGQLWSEIALGYYKFAFPFFLGLCFPWKCFSGMMAGNVSSIPRWKSSLEIKFLHRKLSIIIRLGANRLGALFKFAFLFF